MKLQPTMIVAPESQKIAPPIPAPPPPPQPIAPPQLQPVFQAPPCPAWPTTWFPANVELSIVKVPELKTAPPHPPSVMLLRNAQFETVKIPAFKAPAPLALFAAKPLAIVSEASSLVVPSLKVKICTELLPLIVNRFVPGANNCRAGGDRGQSRSENYCACGDTGNCAITAHRVCVENRLAQRPRPGVGGWYEQ